MGVGKCSNRVDAYEKVTGTAKYAGDLVPGGALIARILHSTIANGLVKTMDVSEAEKIPGVVKIVTCFEVPDIQFPTAGHPWSTEVSHQDVADRRLLNRRVRLWGDDIAAVIAEDEISAERALRAIRVEYEEYPPLVTPEAAAAPGAKLIHEEFPGNVLRSTNYRLGNYDEAVKEPGLRLFRDEFQTQIVQHCHIEPPSSFAYMEKDRVVVVSATQIPHIVRRVVGQALGVPWGKVRLIKPYIGGGFGNKQDALYEPLNAYLSTVVGGRCVKLELTREETFLCTRTRHAIRFDIETAVRPDGTLVARRANLVAAQGGYASHGHAVAANAANEFRHLYGDEKALDVTATTVYTNTASGGAMRGYGIPQAIFAMESHMDDIALALSLDPVEFRRKNMMREGYVDPLTGITCYSSGLDECIRKGMEHIGWKEKRERYRGQTGPVRRGVGMSIFSYKTGVYPISLETSCCRMMLNPDGSLQLQMGATEIGQGADTAFTQMASESTGIREEDVQVVSFQDTDVSPFDLGAYASRQTYVSGMALRDAAEILRRKILDYAEYMLKRPAAELDLRDSTIVDRKTGAALLSLADLSMESYYSLDHCVQITAEASHQCKSNTFSFGACFAEIEVDIPLGRIKVLDLINVHDSGVLINPKVAESQVHGGMSMGLGYALGEQLLYDAKGKPLNGNFLDYKLPTSMDTPELHADFVETVDPSGPYGNKALGEPPAIPVAPALRNALLHATGVGINALPLTPQRLVEEFTKHGLIGEGGTLHV